MTDAERITQMNADRRFNSIGQAGSLYRVELPGIPAAMILANDQEEAIRRYNDLCGITGLVGVRHAVTLLEEYPSPLEDDDAAPVG